MRPRRREQAMTTTIRQKPPREEFQPPSQEFGWQAVPRHFESKRRGVRAYAKNNLERH
jgi:hypothetical protein